MTEDRFSGRSKTLFGAAVMVFFMLVSRCLGLLRDINTAAVMGLSGALALDAFVCAFRIPNIARRFFEEGIFGLTFIPVFSETMKSDPRRAWRLAARYLWYGTLIGFSVTIFLELAVAAVWLGFQPKPDRLWWNILRFAALMFPYILFVIPAAQSAAVLQGVGRFGVAGMMPVIFNAAWLAVLFVVSPIGIYLPFKISPAEISIFGYSSATLSPAGRGAALSLTIALVSAVQFLIQYLWILRVGAAPFIFGNKDPLYTEVAGEIRKELYLVFRKLIPVAFGIFFLQLNMLLATFMAILFSGTSVPVLSAIPGIDFLYAGATGTGAASALYFGERLYEFPLAVVGITLGTAFYPLLAQRFHEKDLSGFSKDFSISLRIVTTLAIPAGIGLAMMAEPLAQLFFAHGASSPEDSGRIARLTLCFGGGVPAFCLAAFLNRVVLAIGKVKWPLAAGIRSLLLFLAAALAMVWCWGEAGLAAAVVTASWGQVLFLFSRLVPVLSGFDYVRLFRDIRNTLCASVMMGLLIWCERLWLAGPLFSQLDRSAALFSGIALDLGVGIFSFGFFVGILSGWEHLSFRRR